MEDTYTGSVTATSATTSNSTTAVGSASPQKLTGTGAVDTSSPAQVVVANETSLKKAVNIQEFIDLW